MKWSRQHWPHNQFVWIALLFHRWNSGRMPRRRDCKLLIGSKRLYWWTRLIFWCPRALGFDRRCCCICSLLLRRELLFTSRFVSAFSEVVLRILRWMYARYNQAYHIWSISQCRCLRPIPKLQRYWSFRENIIPALQVQMYAANWFFNFPRNGAPVSGGGGGGTPIEKCGVPVGYGPCGTIDVVHPPKGRIPIIKQSLSPKFFVVK